MAVDIRKVKKLIELLEESSIAEIEIHEGEESVRISRQSTVTAPIMPAAYTSAPLAQASPITPTVTEPKKDNTDVDSTLSGHVVCSPMVGTVYLAPSPEADDFVSVGQTVSVGDTLCLVEAMKMYNQIEADKAGTIKACMVKTGEAIEFEQPLFIIE
jgi:acetyl-CoA carboxylase biotin carboxyl carrier protein